MAKFWLEDDKVKSDESLDEFDEYQMEQIRWGLEAGMNVSVYADPAFDSNQMVQIFVGLNEGLNVSIYADPLYNSLQMKQLRECLEEGLDVSVYNDPYLEWNKMYDIRCAMESSKLGTSILDFDDNQMEQIRCGLKGGLDISVYADQKYDSDQMFHIRWGLEENLDVSVYADPDIDSEEMNSIRYTMETRIADIVVEDLGQRGISVAPGEVDLRADGIYIDDQKVTTMDDLKTLYPELAFNDLRESLSGQTTDDREVDDEEESLDGE